MIQEFRRSRGSETGNLPAGRQVGNKQLATYFLATSLTCQIQSATTERPISI